MVKIVTFGEVLYLTINFRCPERAFYTPILVLFFVLIFFMRKVVKENGTNVLRISTLDDVVLPYPNQKSPYTIIDLKYL